MKYLYPKCLIVCISTFFLVASIQGYSSNPGDTVKPDFEIIKVYLKSRSQIEVDLKSRVNTTLTIQIFDLSGNQQLAFTESLVIGFNNFSLDVSGLKPGIYVVKISDSNGFKARQTFKFIKF